MPKLPRPARVRFPSLAALTSLLLTPIVVSSLASTAAWSQTPAPTAPADGLRYTDATPDGMIDAALARAVRTGASEADALAAVAMIDELSSRGRNGHAEEALAKIGSGGPAGVRDEALLLRRALAADEGTAAGVAADKALGVATDLAVLGPFRDTGGGLGRKEGPEGGAPQTRPAPKESASSVSAFADRRAHYAWGTVDVAWRAVPPAYAQSSGFPLDVFVSPRKESCSIVATSIKLDAARPIVVRLAASGQARLMFDGTEIGHSEDVNASGLFDRLAGKVDAAAGAHLVWAKLCTGALDDRGAVRLRFTDAEGKPLALATRADELTPAAADAQSRVVPVETPLARAIGAHHDTAGDGPLDEAMLRTVGGADDLRSPRAPGLLDALVRSVGSNADRLAALGWIAPSGANRSGWFNRARGLARASHDARTEDFVSRRLVAEHLNARMGDWAMAELRGAHLDTAPDSEAILLRAMTKALLGTDALNSEALHELAPFGRDAARKQAAPNNALAFLARSAGAFDPALARLAHEELAARGQRQAAWIDAEAGVGKEAVVRAATSTFEGSLGDADEGIAIAQAVSAAGDHPAAQALFGRMVEWAPNRPEAFVGLANETAAVAGPHSHETVVAALNRARNLAPGEARTRAELSLRTSGPSGSAPEPPDDEKYLVSSASILARRLGVPTKGTDVADRQVYFLRAVSMHDDNRVSQLIHYAREIIIAPRTDDELYEEIPSEGDLTEILRARVHKKDGATAFPTEEHNEGNRPRIRWPELSPGDTVEVAVRAWTSTAVGGRGDAPFYFMDFAGAPSTHPTLYNEDVITFPKAHPIWVDVIGAPPGSYARSEHDEGSRHVMRLVWTKPPTVPDEPLAPKLSETTPLVVGSTFHTWADFRAWYAEAVKGFTDPDDEVKHLAAELTKGKTTREAKLTALFDFVSDDIRYVNYVSGEWWLPNRPQQLLARREGDCDDKALLLITLLKAVNIEAEEVMVQTRLTAEPSVLLAKNAAVPMFDHGIAWLPGPNGGRYLDATSPQSRLGPVPSMDARAVALRMAGPPTVVTLPASSPEDHGANVTWNVTLKADGAAEMTGEEMHMGDGAFWLRTNLREPDAREQYVEDNLVAPWFPSSEVDKKIDFKGDLPEGRAWVKYSAHSQGLARHESGELVVPVSPSQTLASQLAPLVRRTLPVVLPPYLAPMHQVRTLKVTAAPGFTWVEPPAGGTEDGGEFGKAELAIARDPHDARVMVITRKTSFDASTIPVEKYGAWRAWLQRVDALMHKTVRMAPSGGGK